MYRNQEALSDALGYILGELPGNSREYQVGEAVFFLIYAYKTEEGPRLGKLVLYQYLFSPVP